MKKLSQNGCGDIYRERLEKLFPRASKSFFDANSGLRPEKPEPATRPALVGATPGEEKGNERVSVRFVLYRVRLLDPDNAVGATKTITDCLCQVGILPGDAESQINLEVTQEKVNHYNEQKTEVHIKYP